MNRHEAPFFDLAEFGGGHAHCDTLSDTILFVIETFLCLTFTFYSNEDRITIVVPQAQPLKSEARGREYSSYATTCAVKRRIFDFL